MPSPEERVQRALDEFNLHREMSPQGASFVPLQHVVELIVAILQVSDETVHTGTVVAGLDGTEWAQHYLRENPDCSWQAQLAMYVLLGSGSTRDIQALLGRPWMRYQLGYFLDYLHTLTQRLESEDNMYSQLWSADLAAFDWRKVWIPVAPSPTTQATDHALGVVQYYVSARVFGMQADAAHRVALGDVSDFELKSVLLVVVPTVAWVGNSAAEYENLVMTTVANVLRLTEEDAKSAELRRRISNLWSRHMQTAYHGVFSDQAQHFRLRVRL